MEEHKLDIAGLAGLDRIEIRAGMLVEGFLAGIHRSPRKGNCPEFREFRDYRAGDSIRDIDWRASGRSDRLQLRIRDDETDLKCRIVLDVSRSLGYKGKKAALSKWEYARTLAAALILLLQHQGDAAGLTLLGRRAEQEFPPSPRESHRLRMFRALDRTPVADAFHLAPCLTRLAGETAKGMLTVVISDFYLAPESLRDALDAVAAARSKALLFQVLDDSELELEWDGPVLLTDPEGEARLIVHPDERRKGYRQAVERHLARLKAVALETGNEYALFRTSELPVEALQRVMIRRKELMR